MRGVLWMGCAVLAVAGGAAAQDREPRIVTTRVRHVSTIVLPATDTIVDVIAGDGEYWDVSASAHVAFIRPLMAGAESNLVILTAAGAVIPLVVVERSDAPVDAVVQLGPATGPATAPVAAVAAAAALEDLRLDDLTWEQRVPQATLAVLSASTELSVAQGQLAAYQAARETREQYEAERMRREAIIEWQAGMGGGRVGGRGGKQHPRGWPSVFPLVA